MRRNSETTDAACYFVDTARIYAGGKTEHIVGGALLAMGDTDYVYVGTKAHPSQPGGLSKAGQLWCHIIIGIVLIFLAGWVLKLSTALYNFLPVSNVHDDLFESSPYTASKRLNFS